MDQLQSAQDREAVADAEGRIAGGRRVREAVKAVGKAIAFLQHHHALPRHQDGAAKLLLGRETGQVGVESRAEGRRVLTVAACIHTPMPRRPALPAALPRSPRGGDEGRPAVAGSRLSAATAVSSSLADWKRRPGSLASAFWIRASHAAGTAGLSVLGRGGSSWTCLIATASASSPSKGGRPVTMWKNKAPKA